MLTKLKGRLAPTLVAAAIAGTLVVGGGSAVAAKAMIDGHDIAKKSIPAGKLTEKARERLAGAQGPVGPQGEPGVDGKDGSAILGGAGAPASLDGKVGDYYFDTAGTTLYGPKSESAGWGMGTSLKGDQGDQGDPGDPGDPGESGAGSSVGFYERTSDLDSVGGKNDAYCDPGDTAIGGGGSVMNFSNLDHPVPGAIASSVRVSGGDPEGWTIAAVTSSHKSWAVVTCADTSTQQ